METPTPDRDSPSFIREELARQTSPEGTASASIFLKGSVAETELPGVAARLVADARQAGGELQLGRIWSLAKSFSVTGDSAAIGRLLDAPEVKSILPSEIDDIYPKPVNVRKID